MPRRTLFLAVLFLILLGAALHLGLGADAVSFPIFIPPTEDLEPASPLVSGRVLDTEGRPVSGAEVRFTLNPESRLCEGLPPEEQQRLLRVRSDADGAFRIDTLRPGAPYDVVVVRRGFATLLTLFSSRPVGVTPELRLVLRPGKAARGQVLDDRGRPVEGAHVWLNRSIRDGVFTIVPLRKVWADRGLHQATTGPDGRFEVADLPEQALDLTIWGSGFSPLGRVGIRPAAEEDALDLGTFQLQPGEVDEELMAHSQGLPIPLKVKGWRLEETGASRYPVRGRVLDPDGEPVEGAPVAVDGHLAAATGPDGRFVLLLEDGVYDVESQREGLAPSPWQSVRVAGGPVDDVEIRLPPGITLTGQLTGMTPEEIGETAVRAVPLSETWLSDIFWEAVVDSKGSYRLPGLAPGEWTLAVHTGQRDTRASVILEEADETRELDLELPEPAEARSSPPPRW